MAVKNSTILGKIWMNGSNDYQQRVPNPSQARMSETMKALFDPMNRDLYNQFINSFINLIGEQRVHTQLWENPLTIFKGKRLLYGSTIQESAVKWIKAHAYDDASEELLKLERPEAEVWYHSLNRQDKYKISVNREELYQAFRDEYGLNRLINAIMNAPINSDNYDEYNLMMNLMTQYEEMWGFYKQNVSAMPTDETTGKEFLTSLRTFANVLKFPSTQYNAADVNVPVFAKPDELVLIIDANTDASVDVNTLAGVFNLDKADVKYRKVVVPHIPVENAFALLTTDSFFVVNDKLYETDSFYNPETLSQNFYLHHWEIVSASPFVPAILFTTDEGTNLTEVTMSPSGFYLDAVDGDTMNPVNSIKAGDMVQLTGSLAGDVTPDGTEVKLEPNAFTVELAAYREDPDTRERKPLPLNSRTYVDGLRRLHVQKTGLEPDDIIEVKGTSTYINPDGTTPTITPSTIELTIIK
ncbi:MAG: hypothetical protein K2H01_01545 [Ruminococcus sp.]|nr:hypothetical protein [Ruminococcus sp.]